MMTAVGGDRGTALLMGGQVDIVLQGPETLIFIENSESPEKVKMFSAITATDGLFLMSRQKVAAGDFKWDMLKGKRVMGWRPGSTPALFLEHVMRKNGVEPKRDTDYLTNIAIPARMGAWQANQADFAIFTEPDPSRIEAEGQGYIVASIGKEAGPADYTGFIATESYIKKNPEIVQAFTNAIYKAQLWSAKADPKEAATLVAGYFPGVSVDLLASSIKRYRDLGIIKFDPVTTSDALNRLQDIMVEGEVLKADKKVKYDRVIVTTFAEKAKQTIK
jgi:NitT/TauT family transport system substrate-binding protein